MSRLPLGSVRPLRFGLFVLAALVPLFAIVLFLRGNGSQAAASTPAPGASKAVTSVASHRVGKVPGAKPGAEAPPTATEFAGLFVGATDRYAKAHGDDARIVRPHCVAAAPGRYMCAYSVEKPGVQKECHLMQARWTPERASAFTVTLSGRTRKCGSLREAIRSLQ